MVPKRIAMKSFADFVAGTEAGKRAILRRYKYPSDEGLAMAAYYHPAKSQLVEFLRDNHDVQWLLGRAQELEQRALTPNKSLRTKLLNNARAIRSYAEHFGDSEFQLLPTIKFHFHLNGVTVNVTPDIHVIDGAGKHKYITFNFCQKKIKHEYVRAVVRCMSYGTFLHSVPSTDTAFIDVANGTVHSGVAVTPDIVGELSNQCDALQAAWNSL